MNAAATTHLGDPLTIFSSDSFCKSCKCWVTVYVTSPERPSKKAGFQFICTCNRIVDAAEGNFVETPRVPLGAISAKLLPA